MEPQISRTTQNAVSNSRSPMNRPWFIAVIDKLPGPRWLDAVILGICWMGLDAGVSVLFGLLSGGSLLTDPSLPRHWVRHSFLLGYLGWAAHYVTARFSQSANLLQPVMSLAPKSCEKLHDEWLFYERRALRYAALMGVAFAIGLHFTVVGMPRASFVYWWLLLARMFLCSVWVPCLYMACVCIGRLRFLVRSTRISLFDSRPLRPLAVLGLVLSLVAVVGVSGAMLMPLPLGGQENYLFSGAVAALTLVFAIASAVAPAQAIHSKIREAKNAELDRVLRAIEGDRDAFASSPMSRHADSIVGVHILDYREKVQAVQEWPFTVDMLRTLFLYLLIPFASWIAGALVERVIDAWFG